MQRRCETRINTKGATIIAQSTYAGSERISDLKEKAIDQFGKAENMANRVAEQSREEEVTGNMKGAIDRSVKDQPMATLAMAAVVGFVLGALWKS
jgi:ElaB/YqjD/DUF883 family membrane-anchored ribosome-binding protein